MQYIEGIAILGEDDDFPDANFARPDMPAAIGQLLNAELMVAAYKRGIFAWSDSPVTWWSPDPRAIIELDGLHISKSLARKIRKNPFKVTVDYAFGDVLCGCAAPRKEESGTWLTDKFFYSFCDLFYQGYAHSVECWQNGVLVGGVFGIAIDGFFSAESMFHKATDASKIALYYLVELLKQAGFKLLDIQVITPHTQSLGAVLISRASYLRLLKKALKLRVQPLSKRVIIDI